MSEEVNGGWSCGKMNSGENQICQQRVDSIWNLNIVSTALRAIVRGLKRWIGGLDDLVRIDVRSQHLVQKDPILRDPNPPPFHLPKRSFFSKARNEHRPSSRSRIIHRIQRNETQLVMQLESLLYRFVLVEERESEKKEEKRWGEQTEQKKRARSESGR